MSGKQAAIADNTGTRVIRSTERVAGTDLASRLAGVRQFTERLAAPLSAEDCMVQSMPDASPVKWHLAHTTWFFETFILIPHAREYRCRRPEYQYLFNSYYNALGDRLARPSRALLSRPSLSEVRDYRSFVDEALWALVPQGSPEVQRLAEIGLHHEQQHQELLLTDIKHAFWSNPLRPPYHTGAAAGVNAQLPIRWIDHPGGMTTLGWTAESFCFDNERPAHQVYLQPFQFASRLVSNAEYAEFIDAGGYREPQWWLSEGWDLVRNEGWQAPLYWEHTADGWNQMTLAGLREVKPHEPVSHVSLYEAEAYARWSGGRLPTEAEWEAVAAPATRVGNFVESARLHPCAPAEDAGTNAPLQMFGDVWEWTASPFRPYPGYAPEAGALGEYNGKFMCNQFVLRGGSCATSVTHIRPTYRNFFHPEKRWQFSGIRLARDAPSA